MGSSVTKRRKSWEKVPILGSYLKFRGQNLGYLSFIFLEAKFGAPTRISEAKFGAKPPRPSNMEVPPWEVFHDLQLHFTHKSTNEHVYADFCQVCDLLSTVRHVYKWSRSVRRPNNDIFLLVLQY